MATGLSRWFAQYGWLPFSPKINRWFCFAHLRPTIGSAHFARAFRSSVLKLAPDFQASEAVANFREFNSRVFDRVSHRCHFGGEPLCHSDAALAPLACVVTR